MLDQRRQPRPGLPVDIAVGRSADQVRVRASSPGAGPAPAAPGRGLTGMRYRAELPGGETPPPPTTAGSPSR
ncbi:hypothetical protein [Pseudonocardia thermophila]|uniref:hypothetical protein n=1 Tax=Pseudonocardia thermophila TaxID=1848 RepID=UPI001F452976|nr:hypothetical protein [Pseudonocardia thermophila]